MKGLKILNIKQSETRPILMLITYSFFMGLSIAFYFTATISDFLTNFDITLLPYTYILSGVLGYFLWLAWSYLEKKVPFTTRVMMGITFLVITVTILGVGTLYFYKEWISLVMLVWVRVFIFVNVVNFWGMSGKLFNLSQGKRLFGLISVGTVISDIFGFFSIPFILLLGVSNPGLIIISIFTLIICLFITLQITRVFKEQLSERIDQTKVTIRTSRKEPLFKNTYQMYLFILAILPMFGFYFVDYLFLDQVQVEFKHSAEALAGFMGIFFGVVAIFELLVKTSVFSRLINNFGLKVALLVLPGILLITVFLTITIGMAAGTFGFLFSMIAFIKLLEKILRSGVNDPSFQILYQPIPSKERLAFQSKMEGVPSALGNIAAGGIILLLIFFELTDPVLYNSIFFIVLVVWCYMAIKLQKEYRNVIVNSLSDPNEEVDEEDSDYSPSKYLFSNLENQNTKELVSSLYLAKNIDLNQIFNKIELLINHTSSQVRLAVIKSIRKYKLKTLIPSLEQLNNSENQNSGVSPILRLTVNELNNYKYDEVNLASKISDGESEIEKLKQLDEILSSNNTEEKVKILEKRLLDHNHSVVYAALEQLPDSLDQSHANLVVHSLKKMPLSYLTFPFLKKKNKFVERLFIKNLQQQESGLWSNVNSQIFALQIVKALGYVGDKDAKAYLIKLLNSNTSETKLFVAKALDKLDYTATKEESILIVQLIEKEAAFCTWLLSCEQDIKGLKKGGRELVACLQREYVKVIEKIFVLLSFLYPRNVIQKISSNIRDRSTQKNVLGIEMCEMVLSNTLKPILIPLFSNFTTLERIKILKKEFPQERLTPIERLENIVYYDFTEVNLWIKIMAMYILAKKVKTVPKEIYANLYIKNPVIKESAYLAISKINKEEFHKRIATESNEYKLYFDRLLGIDPALGKQDTIFERVNKLKRLRLFKDVHEVILIKVAMHLIKIDLSGSEFYSKEYLRIPYIHFISRGKLDVVFSENDIERHSDEAFGLFDAFNLRDVRFEAKDKTQILAIEANTFFELVSTYDELAYVLKSYMVVQLD